MVQRVAALHDLQVPDKNVIRYPAHLLNRGVFTRATARRAIVQLPAVSFCRRFGLSKAFLAPSLSPLALNSCKRGSSSPMVKSRLGAAVGGARGLLARRRQSTCSFLPSTPRQSRPSAVAAGVGRPGIGKIGHVLTGSAASHVQRSVHSGHHTTPSTLMPRLEALRSHFGE